MAESFYEKFLKYYLTPLLIAFLILILAPLSMEDRILSALVIIVISLIAVWVYHKWRSHRRKPLEVSTAKIPW